MARVDLSHMLNRSGRCRNALFFCQARQKEVSMLRLKHIGAAAIATVIATAIGIDTADARRGGGGGGARASSLGGGARAANAGSVARVANPIRRADIGRPGRPGFRPGWGWGGGWGGPGWGWGAAA